MKVTAAQLLIFAEALVDLAQKFDPKDAESIRDVIDAGSDLNGLIKDIRDQTQENAQEVWDKVRTDYSENLARFQASLTSHEGADSTD
jgi:hypothetical protein